MYESALIVPPELHAIVKTSVGALAEKLAGTMADVTAMDHLNVGKSFKRAQILQRYYPLTNAKVLEIGSGFGTNLALWMKLYDIDAHGIEADSEGFGSSLEASRILFHANGLPTDRLQPGFGENLPFDDRTFDVVYSANVLEHTQSPATVLKEAVRVLRPGVIVHMELPNYLSYFEGHYMVVQPPILWPGLLPAWLKYVGRRDPSFAHTLRTEINPLWCR